MQARSLTGISEIDEKYPNALGVETFVNHPILYSYSESENGEMIKKTIAYIPSYDNDYNGIKNPDEVIGITIIRENVSERDEVIVLEPLSHYYNLRQLKIVGDADNPSLLVGFQKIPRLHILEMVNCQVDKSIVDSDNISIKIILENTSIGNFDKNGCPRNNDPIPMTLTDKMICLSFFMTVLVWISGFMSIKNAGNIFHSLDILSDTNTKIQSLSGFNLSSVQNIIRLFM
jgi:hypothetical protein